MPINNPSTPSLPSLVELVGGDDYDVVSADTWEDWDISASVPVNARYAEILIINTLASFNLTIGVRERGSALARTWAWGQTTGSGIQAMTIKVSLDVNRILQIRSSDNANPKFNVIGYWI